MTNETRQEKFAQNLLPWMLAAVMLLLYLATMGHGVTFSNLGMVAQLSGWDWPQNNLPPVLLVVTYPLRWLPASMLPLALNLLAAVGGTLTLWLLARSVALLPHDRTQAQRDRERSENSFLSISAAWLPPVLAVLACGLQLTFWENSMDGTGRILDVLLFAYPIRCLLEFRRDGKQSWLVKAALVYGLGMANHWLMILFLPAFLAALLWIKGTSFFNLGFLGRMIAAGLVGTSFCLLMPLAQSMGAGANMTLGEAMHSYFVGQKMVLSALPFRLLWVMGLTSLLPVAILAVRWATSFGDNSPMGAALAGFMFHVVHGVFLVVCLWQVFDSPFSPRTFTRQLTDLHPYFANQPWLPLYYLGALAMGYFSGYFLLVFDNRSKLARRESGLGRWVNSLLTAGVWVFLFIVPLGLVLKNISYVRITGSRMCSTLGRNLTEGLPENGAVLLSDDANLLLLAETTLHQRNAASQFVFLNTASLSSPRYHDFLRASFPNLWPARPTRESETNQIGPLDLVQMLTQQAQTRPTYYLHPSFGYYFERFYVESHGLIFKLQSYATNTVFAPAISPELATDNQAFWKRIDLTALAPVVRQLSPGKTEPSDLTGKLLDLIKAKREPNPQAALIGAYYSRSLNDWGVDSQRRGDLPDADWAFHRALELNPQNVVAEINQTCNQTLRAGGFQQVPLGNEVLGKLNQYRSSIQLLNANGSFDEPRFDYQQGIVFIQGGLYRQAAQEFNRVKELMPDEPSAYVWLAQIHNLWQMPDQALALINAASALPAARTNSQAELVSAKATAYLIKKDNDSAAQAVETALQKNPDDQSLENIAVQLFMTIHRQTNALALIDRQLQRSPDDLAALNNQGVANIQLGHFAQAIPPLDRLITLQPTNYVAVLNRAIALLQSDRLEDSQRDYETLAAKFPTAFQIYYGLGEIAERRKDHAAAIKDYGLYLQYAPPDSDESKHIQKRLAELKSASP